MGYIKFLEDIPLFEMKLDQLRYLAEYFGLEINELSPLIVLKSSEISSYGEISDSNSYRALMEVLCKPRLKSQFSKAGIEEETEKFTVYAGIVEERTIFIFYQEVEDLIKLLLFDSVEELSTYVVSRYATMNAQFMKLEGGFETDINHFILTLNMIDCVRRRYLTGLLSGEHTSLEFITLEDYLEELDFNLRHSDVRWLLPAALKLLPKLPLFKFEFDPEKITFSDQYNLITRYQSDRDEAVLYYLSESIKKLGLDFTHHWKYALGFYIRDIDEVMTQCFLAPTGEVNQFFELTGKRENGKCIYKPMTFNALVTRFEDLFREALLREKEVNI